MIDNKINEMVKECDHLIGTEFTLCGAYGSQNHPLYLSRMRKETIEHIGRRYNYCPLCGKKLDSVFKYLEKRDGKKYKVFFESVLSPHQPVGYIPHWGDKTKLEDWHGMYIDNKYRILESFRGKDIHGDGVVVFTCYDGEKNIELRYKMNEEVTIYSIRREYGEKDFGGK